MIGFSLLLALLAHGILGLGLIGLAGNIFREWSPRIAATSAIAVLLSLTYLTLFF